MNKKLQFGFKALTAGLMLLLSACTTYHEVVEIDTANLGQLENASFQARRGIFKTSLGGLRVRALTDTALSIGAQGGLAAASGEINGSLTRDSKYLDSIYNFNALVLNHGVMPPVLEAGDNSLNLADPNTIRVADRTYKIVQQARFATTPPNWREYLWFNFTKPELPDRTLLPRNSAEAAIWRKYIREGWDSGVIQAHNIFQQNMARLRRDFRGMLLYRKLLEEHMISPPFVARTELGVTGDGEDMRINDQVLRIVELPRLQTNSRGWRAIVVEK